MSVNEIVDGIPYPCQPIGCDAGHHLAGCIYIEMDKTEPEAPASVEGETHDDRTD